MSPGKKKTNISNELLVLAEEADEVTRRRKK